jgi:predicted nuclease of predicted toxin-antitoxin system
VTFLLDHDVPDDITYSLHALGHGVKHLRDVLPKEATDQQVMEQAYKDRCILISSNRDDFLKLASFQPHCGIIILIRRKTRLAERAALIGLIDGAGESGLANNINFA